MPINCLINSEQIVNNSCSNNQFMVNSWTIHENSCFKKMTLSSLPLSSSLSSSFSSLFLSFPLSSSHFLSFPPLLSFFNVLSSRPANSLKTKGLKKRHFWLQIFESREAAKTQIVRRKICPIFCPLPRRPYTPHAAQNWPYMLRCETLHHVRFYVGFADQTLHTQRRWLSNLKSVLCRICRECMNPLKTV